MEDGDLATYKPSASEYSIYVAFTIGGCLVAYPLFAHVLVFVAGVLLFVVKTRDYPFYIEWAFVAPFFIIVISSFCFELYMYKEKKENYIKITNKIYF